MLDTPGTCWYFSSRSADRNPGGALSVGVTDPGSILVAPPLDPVHTAVLAWLTGPPETIPSHGGSRTCLFPAGKEWSQWFAQASWRPPHSCSHWAQPHAATLVDRPRQQVAAMIRPRRSSRSPRTQRRARSTASSSRTSRTSGRKITIKRSSSRSPTAARPRRPRTS